MGLRNPFLSGLKSLYLYNSFLQTVILESKQIVGRRSETAVDDGVSCDPGCIYSLERKERRACTLRIGRT